MTIVRAGRVGNVYGERPGGLGLAACVTVGDRAAADAARDLATHGVDAGPCGAAALAALDALAPLRAGSTVLLLVTEGSAANPTRRAVPVSVRDPRS